MPIDEFKQLKAERKLVQDMQLYYSKHEGLVAEDIEIADIIELLLRW